MAATTKTAVRHERCHQANRTHLQIQSALAPTQAQGGKATVRVPPMRLVAWLAAQPALKRLTPRDVVNERLVGEAGRQDVQHSRRGHRCVAAAHIHLPIIVHAKATRLRVL